METLFAVRFKTGGIYTTMIIITTPPPPLANDRRGDRRKVFFFFYKLTYGQSVFMEIVVLLKYF